MSKAENIISKLDTGPAEVAPIHDSEMSSRAIAEVQAQVFLAKRYPRDVNGVIARIVTACKRASLAESALYRYPRGGQVVEGASIRLAEAIAQLWGNLDYGVRELGTNEGSTHFLCYCVDLESNVRKVIDFSIKHERWTKRGRSVLVDPRDVYEHGMNYAARRLRNCILAVIPGDVVELAATQCRKTITGGDAPIEDRIRKMVVAFDEQGVPLKSIEKRLGHKVSVTSMKELGELIATYNGIKDGHGSREEYFDLSDKAAAVLGKTSNEETPSVEG